MRDAWRTMTARLAPGGLLVEGTCDELGRHAWWVALEPGADEPRSRSRSRRGSPGSSGPRDLAERLPKALIHRNVPGEPVHALLDRARPALGGGGAAGRRSAYGSAGSPPSAALRDGGVPVLDGPSRWRLGELTVPWSLVAPR